MMDVKPGREVSFVLASPSGRPVLSFDEAAEPLARQRAAERGLRLFRTTRVTEEVPL